MELWKWGNGLRAYLFAGDTKNVRLFDADGFVLKKVYNDECHTEGEPFLENKDGAAKDFFRAVIQEILLNRNFAPTTPIRLTEIANALIEWRDGKASCRQEVLPLCYFLSSIWSFEFQDAEDVQGNDADFRQRRFAEALKWAMDGDVDGIEYDKSTQYFSRGVENLFRGLKSLYGERLFWPGDDFKIGNSLADGLTLSHAIFRWGEIASLYTTFSEWGFVPGRSYEGAFEKVAAECFDDDWMKGRAIEMPELSAAVEQLYKGWDGKPRERYHSLRRVDMGCRDRAVAPVPSSKCKLYWGLTSIDAWGHDFFTLKIIVDGIETQNSGFLVKSGDNPPIRLANEIVEGLTTYVWDEEPDERRGQSGWSGLKCDDEIDVFEETTSARLDTLPSFRSCFDGHGVFLLQSWTPLSGGRPIWRLMSGTQGVRLWGGDDRPKDPAYAILSPGELHDEDVMCNGVACRLGEPSLMTIDENEYFVYRLKGDLEGVLCVSGVRLHNFGLPHDEKVAQNFYVADDFLVYRLYDSDSNFVAPCQTTVFYFPNELRIGVYYKQSRCGHEVPRLYTVSEQDIVSFEVEPMSKHKVEMEYDSKRGLWLTDVYEECDIPYAVGLLSDDDRQLVFKRLDVSNGGVDYHKSWQGYFLPELRCDEDLLVLGALLTHGFERWIHEVLSSNSSLGTEETNEILRIKELVSGIKIQDVQGKLLFIQWISKPLLTTVVDGWRERLDIFSVKQFSTNCKFPVEMEALLNCIRRKPQFVELEDYFAWALILLAFAYDRPHLQERVSHMGELRRTLKGYYQIVKYGIFKNWYSPEFICEGIVHAVLDEIPKEQAEPILRRCVALADSLVARCR